MQFGCELRQAAREVDDPGVRDLEVAKRLREVLLGDPRRIDPCP
jgi:hypothetical protein